MITKNKIRSFQAKINVMYKIEIYKDQNELQTKENKWNIYYLSGLWKLTVELLCYRGIGAGGIILNTKHKIVRITSIKRTLTIALLPFDANG